MKKNARAAKADLMYKITTVNGIINSDKPGIIGGHSKLLIYGSLECPSALRYLKLGHYKKYRVFFHSIEAAISCGYRPCARCFKKDYDIWKSKL